MQLGEAPAEYEFCYYLRIIIIIIILWWPCLWWYVYFSLSGFYAFSRAFIGLLAIHCLFLIVSYSLSFVPVLVAFIAAGKQM